MELESQIDEIDAEIAHFELLLTNEDFVSTPGPDQDLISKIYAENRAKRMKTVKNRLSIATSSRPHTFVPSIYMTLESYPHYQENIDKHEGLKDVISKRIHERRLKYQKKATSLRKEFKKLQDAHIVYTTKLEKQAKELPASIQKARTNVFISDTVRSEAEWEAVLARLGDDESRYATIPDMVLDPAERKPCMLRNFLVSDVNDEWKKSNFVLDHGWSYQEKEIFKEKLGVYGKNFKKISDHLPLKSYNECVAFYYREKKRCGLKRYLKRGRRGGLRVKDDSLNPPTVIQTPAVADAPAVINGDAGAQEPESKEETQAQPAETTEPGAPTRKRRGRPPSAPALTADEKIAVMELMLTHGRDFVAIGKELNLADDSIRQFCDRYDRKLQLDVLYTVPELERSYDITETQLQLLSSYQDLEGILQGERESKGYNDEVIEDKKRKYLRGAKKKDEDEPPAQMDGKKRRRRGRKKIEDAPVIEEEVVKEQLVASIDKDDENSRKTVSYWSVHEKSEFVRALTMFGKNWDQIAKHLQTKSAIQSRNFYHNYRARLELDKILEDGGHSNQDDKDSIVGDDEIKEELHPENEKLIEPAPAPVVTTSAVSTPTVAPVAPTASHYTHYMPTTYYGMYTRKPAAVMVPAGYQTVQAVAATPTTSTAEETTQAPAQQQAPQYVTSDPYSSYRREEAQPVMYHHAAHVSRPIVYAHAYPHHVYPTDPYQTGYIAYVPTTGSGYRPTYAAPPAQVAYTSYYRAAPHVMHTNAYYHPSVYSMDQQQHGNSTTSGQAAEQGYAANTENGDQQHPQQQPVQTGYHVPARDSASHAHHHHHPYGAYGYHQSYAAQHGSYAAHQNHQPQAEYAQQESKTPVVQQQPPAPSTPTIQAPIPIHPQPEVEQDTGNPDQPGIPSRPPSSGFTIQEITNDTQKPAE